MSFSICEHLSDMRLINVYDLSLREFAEDNLPSYTIASHRWTENEATFRELWMKQSVNKAYNIGIARIFSRWSSNFSTVDSAGYLKIQKFCAFARQRNDERRQREPHEPQIEWLWIDTACINKESSEELSRAINSMFTWYSAAYECYAYLADVDPHPASDTATINRVGGSDWFQRGWTLQELLAPRRVIFLDCAWNVIGHKCQTGMCTLPDPYKSACYGAGKVLNSELASITGISYQVISLGNMWSESVEERAKWIHNRVTKQIEDIAYCLIGIFGISMSLRYGEGCHAWSRLERKISKKYDEKFSLPPPSSILMADLRNYDMYDRGVRAGFVNNAVVVRSDHFGEFQNTPSATAIISTPVDKLFCMRNWLAEPPDLGANSIVSIRKYELPSSPHVVSRRLRYASLGYRDANITKRAAGVLENEKLFTSDSEHYKTDLSSPWRGDRALVEFQPEMEDQQGFGLRAVGQAFASIPRSSVGSAPSRYGSNTMLTNGWSATSENSRPSSIEISPTDHADALK